MRRRRWAPLVLVLAATGAVAAPSAARAAAPIPLREYVQRADRVCREADRAGDAIGLPPEDAAAVPAWFDRTAAISIARAQGLQAIPLPGSRRVPAKELRALFPQELRLIAAMQRDLHAGATYLQVLRKHEQRLDALGRSENRRWKALGVRACLNDVG